MTSLRLVNTRAIGAGAEGIGGSITIRDGLLVRDDDPVERTLDVHGALVAPGFIDLHAHVYPGATSLGIDADRVGVDQGATTVVDAGSAGDRDLDAFLDDVARTARTRVLAWVNIGHTGLVDGRHELADLADLDAERTAASIAAHREHVIGIKARMSSSVVRGNGTRPLEIALDAAIRAGVPVMIHTGNEPPSMLDCLDLLRPGDVASHAYHGKVGGILAGEELRPQARAAYDRGVRFDVGHGEASFAFRVARTALALGAAPFTISTDIHIDNVEAPVVSLARTLDKLMALGMDLGQVIPAVTAHPAAVIGRPELGTLAVGTPADLTVFDVIDTDVELTDADGDHATAARSIHPSLAIREGEIHECR